MRKVEEYERHGRNDPLAPEQLRQHPYDFVSLPPAPAAGLATGHDRYPRQRLSGWLRLVYETLTPLHVGSGVFETAAECGLAGGQTPVRGILRRQGRPVLPGSGWKGAVRARFEAITGSRLALVDTSARQPSFKVPEALRSGQGSHRVEIRDPRVRQTLAPAKIVGNADQLAALSPAEALFGGMGYRGRLHPGDGVIDGPSAGEPLRIAPMESPVMHRLAKPGAAHKAGHGKIEVAEVEGRKFYYDGPIVESRITDHGSGGSYEYLDYVPAGASLAIDVHLEALAAVELGALLVSAGWGEGVGVVRFGGFKSVGLGKVRLESASAEVVRGSSTSSWRRPAAEVVDPATVVGEAMATLIDLRALRELDEITRRQRPA
jgi:CRISPR/Cas system CSM-associated protein Csm3 (group 7 of RAMP superfamily)